MRIRKLLLRVSLVLVALAGLVGVAAYNAFGTFAVPIPDSLKGDQAGTLVSVQRTGSYPLFVVKYILHNVDLPDPVNVTCGITLYRVGYRTTMHDGSAAVASGLVALPKGRVLNSLVVYHHGTSAERKSAPSQPGLGEGLFVAAATAGSGHVLVAPDYIGLGESVALHPYMVARTTASASIDLLHAARALVEHLRGTCPTRLYLTGFSQGGHATFAVQRDLERAHDSPFTVKASAPIAGPFHLRNVSFPQALTGKSPNHAFYLAYLANAYAAIYRRPLKSILTSPYVENVPVLFNGEHTTEEIMAAMPGAPRDLFNPEFLDAYDHGQPHWFLDAMAENDVDDWTPAAPVRIYFGDDDLDVLPEEARRAEAAMKKRGADVLALSVGACGHESSAFRAFPKALRWFKELDDQK